MPQNLSDRFRSKRDVRLRQLIEAVGEGQQRTTIIDMGGTVLYWQRVGFEYLRSRGVRITIVNLHESQLGNGPPDIFEMAVGDACNLSQIADKTFDIAHSNSVIEHVRSWEAMRDFASETKRVGRNFYVQTPNFWFPIDPHYYRLPMFHWLPNPMRARLFRSFPIAHVGRITTWDKAYELLDASRLLSKQQLKTLFPDCKIFSERVLGLTKSFVCIKQT